MRSKRRQSVLLTSDALEPRLHFAAAPKGFAERWESAPFGEYIPTDTNSNGVGTTLSGDGGTWFLGDTVSQSFPDDEEPPPPSPHRAAIISYNGGKALRLTSNVGDGSAADNVYISIGAVGSRFNRGFSVPLGPGTTISFTEEGSLQDPEGGRGVPLVPPSGDTICLKVVVGRDLGDAPGNGAVLAYVLQRAPDHDVVEEIPNYGEILLDPSATSFQRDLFADFSTIPAFDASNPDHLRITSLDFAINEHGTAILDDLVIGGGAAGPGGSDPGAVDLTGTFADVAIPSALVAGASAKCRATLNIKNGGSTPVPKGAAIDVTFAARPVDGGPDVPLLTLSKRPVSNLAAGKAKPLKTSFLIPASLAGGEYRVVASLDVNQSVAETNDTNNEVVADSPFSVSEAFVDLAATVVPPRAPLAPGRKASLGLRMTNNGNVAVRQVVPVEVLASLDQANVPGDGDVPISTPPLKLNLRSATTGAAKLAVTVPATGTLPPGTYFLLAILNSDAVLHESDVTNNLVVLGQFTV